MAPPSNSTDQASSIPLYDGVLPGFTLYAILEGIDDTILNYAIMDITPQIITDLKLYKKVIIPTQLYIYNPLDAAITLTSTDLYVVYEGVSLGYCKTNVTSANQTLAITVPPNSSILSAAVPVTADAGSFKDKELLLNAFETQLINGYVCLGVQGTFWATIGDISVEPYYSQPETIPTCNSLHRGICINASKYQNCTWNNWN